MSRERPIHINFDLVWRCAAFSTNCSCFHKHYPPSTGLSARTLGTRGASGSEHPFTTCFSSHRPRTESDLIYSGLGLAFSRAEASKKLKSVGTFLYACRTYSTWLKELSYKTNKLLKINMKLICNIPPWFFGGYFMLVAFHRYCCSFNP